MTVLNIAGKRITVDDTFEKLSPEQQNSAVEEIAKSLGASAPPKPDQQTVTAKVEEPVDPRDTVGGKADAFMRGAADTLTFGASDELAAHVRSNPLAVPAKPDSYYDQGIYAGKYNPLGAIARTLDAPFTSETKNADYEKALAEERAVNADDDQNRGGYRIGGQLAGGVMGGVALAKGGLSATANAIERGAGLGRVAAAGAGEGAILGGAQGFGSGEGGFLNRLQSGGVGSLVGVGTGGATPYITAAAGGFLRSLAAPVMARLRPQPAANRALGVALERSGRTPDQVADMLQSAADDGQGVFNVADALGHSGQRMMSSVARTPNDARQEVVEGLLNRQMGQGDRLTNALAEGFDAPETAAQRATALTDVRTADANRNYTAARQSAGAVNVSPILETIDQTLTPGVNGIVSPRDNIGYDTIEGALARVRRMLSDGNSQVTDFNTLFRAKLDLDDMITKAEGQGAGNRAFALGQVHRQVDRALAAASPEYRAANDTFARQSGVIDAVDTGRAATSGRTRADDNIETFGNLDGDQQNAFRAGYVDPLIARVESASAAPTTNKARILNTPKLQEELPAFAAPGQGDQLGRRIDREQRMFETLNQSVGGSRTADNLADMDEIKNFDPTVLTNLFKGDWKSAALGAVTRALNEGKGMPPSVIERIGRSLAETDPEVARRLLMVANSRAIDDTAKRGMATAILNNLSSTVPGRAAAGQPAAPLEITVGVPVR
jgi:hypothetical protein